MRFCNLTLLTEGNYRYLIRDVLKAAEFGTEAEAIDAELERGAAAAEEALEEGFEFERTVDGLIDFGELAGGEFFPAGADGSVVAEAAEEELDLAEGETHFSGEADEEDAMEGFAGIAALAAHTLRRGEQATFFVVADCGGVEAGAGGEFTDFHFRMLSGCESLDVLCQRLAAWLRPEKRRQAAALQGT